MEIKISRILLRIIAAAMVLVLMLVLTGRSCGFLSDASGGAENTGARLEVIRLSRRNMEVPMYYLPDDGTGNDGTVLCQDSEKKKIRIQFSHLLFLNGIFYNILYPMLLFFILIRLFGRNLRVLWQVISYIHVRDDGEYYLLPLLIHKTVF